MRVGADTGGTFTDLVADDGRVVKVPSERAAPDGPLRSGLQGLGAATVLAHGTTVATNALLERRGARVALVATRGFSDTIEIARQARPSLYDPFVDRPEALVDRIDRHEVGGRLDGSGRELEPLDAASVPDVAPGVEAVAVCLLHADLDPSHEQRVAHVLRSRALAVSCSHEVSPEFREYERMVTTVVDAMLRPVCSAYLRSLQSVAPEVLVMTSAGGLTPLEAAARRPAALLLSGPAAGARAAAALAAAVGRPDAVAFDMGGTSTDVCLVRGGAPEPAAGRAVGGLPIRLPALDIHTIGAGGGSIARLDLGGALVVGPRSAGASPGPAAYGRGGREPTVTDADLVLGRIPADAPLPGLGTLDVAAARGALDGAGIDAAGVVAVVDASMGQAVRRVTVERGVDPRELALVAFGGAGPLHACAVAEGLGMPVVIVPPRAGVFSAVGLLAAPRHHESVRSWSTPDDHRGLDNALAALAAATAREVPSSRVDTFVDCRYAGQSHELTVEGPGSFAAEHARRNGYAIDGATVEVVALRAWASGPSPLSLDALPPPARARVRGPAVAAEADCTVWIPDGWTAAPGPLGAWILERSR